MTQRLATNSRPSDLPLSQETLRQIARSFAMTLRFLPSRVRPQVTMAYVLARLADTLSDSGSASSLERLASLTDWENAIISPKAIFRPPLWSKIPSGEMALLSKSELILDAWHRMLEPERKAVLRVVLLLISAMKWDLHRFSGNFEDAPAMTEEDFDWYCYHIAGCVGEFWVDIFQLEGSLRESAVVYGKALQRINILRDMVSDRGRGRWYLPFPKSLEPWREENWSSFLKAYTRETQESLCLGEAFCNSLSRFSPRLRFASELPAAIGVETLKLLADEREWQTPVKISKSVVKRVVFETACRSFLGLHFSRCHRAQLCLK